MANKLYEESNVQAIANAIRAKGQTGTMTVAQMPSKISAIKSKSEYTWNQCPATVKNYLANVTYNPSDYTVSQIETYLTNIPADSKPIGKTIDGVIHYNEVPNVATPFSSTNEAGTVKPLDRLRWIKVLESTANDIKNARDIGGWNCDGGTIKYGAIIRSGDVAANHADVLVNQIGIRAELDLDQDHLEDKSKLGNIAYHGATANVQYSLSNKAAWKDIMRFVFDCVLESVPMVIHCSVGCDRTGTVLCIIEGLLGVSQSDCDKDYELSSFAGADWLRKRNGTSWPSLMNQISAYTGNTFRDKVVNFVASLGFTAEEINAFRAAMIDGTPTTVTPSIATYTVTKNGENVTFSNPSATVSQYQPYECDIAPNGGYVIDGITVTMNGVDVTEQYFSGEQVPFGEEAITANGTHDVSWKKTASVSVPASAVTSGDLNITQNGTYDVTEKKNAVVNVQGGITPSGTKTITENGTYDVASFASAAVNVPSGAANCKRFTLNVTTAKASSQYTIVEGDADVAAHWNDPNAVAVFIKDNPRTNTVGLSFAVTTNSVINAPDSGGRTIYANTTGSAINAATAASTLNIEGTTAGKITAYSNGDLKIYSQSSNNVIRNGTYTVLFCW